MLRCPGLFRSKIPYGIESLFRSRIVSTFLNVCSASNSMCVAAAADVGTADVTIMGSTWSSTDRLTQHHQRQHAAFDWISEGSYGIDDATQAIDGTPVGWSDRNLSRRTAMGLFGVTNGRIKF